ncbi:MAG: TerB family tellurite resistance protein [Bacteroidales bacterium]|nr:TerB family tellurite resistance protein [Bacteroidales bacterium]
MGYGKWIGGALGWALLGPIGGLLGFLLGSSLDTGQSFLNGKEYAGRGAETTYRGTGSIPGARNSFLISMLVLSTAVMKADGRVMRSELAYVKNFIRTNFGEEAVPQALQILKGLLKRKINLQQVCGQINVYMPMEQRLQLVHYLVGIAMADGNVSSAETDCIKSIGGYLNISPSEIESILSMYHITDVNSAYKVLGIEPSATVEEIKKAYKSMAMKHHPDRVATLGEDVRKAAEEKFTAINLAYEKIKKERGFV